MSSTGKRLALEAAIKTILLMGQDGTADLRDLARLWRAAEEGWNLWQENDDVNMWLVLPGVDPSRGERYIANDKAARGSNTGIVAMTGCELFTNNNGLSSILNEHKLLGAGVGMRVHVGALNKPGKHSFASGAKFAVSQNIAQHKQNVLLAIKIKGVEDPMIWSVRVENGLRGVRMVPEKYLNQQLIPRQ